MSYRPTLQGHGWEGGSPSSQVTESRFKYRRSSFSGAADISSTPQTHVSLRSKGSCFRILDLIFTNRTETLRGREVGSGNGVQRR